MQCHFVLQTNPCKPSQTVTHIATMWPSLEQQQLRLSPEQTSGYPGAWVLPGTSRWLLSPCSFESCRTAHSVLVLTSHM